MELVVQADKYYDQAIWTYDDYDKQIELFDKVISLNLQAAEQADTEEEQLFRIGNARHAEANKYAALANKLAVKANESEKTDALNYLRDALKKRLTSNSLIKEAAEIAKELEDMALYYNRLGMSYEDEAFYHYIIAWKSKLINNWNDALKEYKKSYELLLTAIEYYTKSLHLKFNRYVENNRVQGRKYLIDCREDISTSKMKITIRRSNGSLG